MGTRFRTSTTIVALGALLLTGCTQGQAPVTSSNWQVTNVYTDAEHPSILPDSLAGRAHLAFGDSTVVGDTGCAPFTGSVDFLDGEGDRVAATDPTAATFVFRDLRVREDVDCEGVDLYFHNGLLRILHAGELTVARPQDGELLLTDATDRAVDKRAVRLTTSS
ncbi:hypothetical protein M0E87_11730 [Corynebacterium sp. CCM 9185]|uniref:META domain-containing protein n=1 Tax=Corynebacterium marambiense TaxID=2765364 RepID=A0ABS0VWC6_9CORY|nr:hypothetical protein [Corynebacterium marambiense]MBI9001078.1 hypothetical protein [Corynebacterium marambiense]MCK7664319.1 hypothetical protein [Corynebacterium marambiense]MCX7543132.1 hypothetical protein [Corynebacterium marambiense]